MSPPGFLYQKTHPRSGPFYGGKVNEKKEDDLPKKINDHHVDAMRYVVYSLNKRGSSHGTVMLPEGM